MTLACHHAPRETGTSCQPRCRRCNVVIGRARCNTCLGSGRWQWLGQSPLDCSICDGRGFYWVEVRTFAVTPTNRSEGQP